MVEALPRNRFKGARPEIANYFIETVFMQRALSTLLIDLLNVVVGGSVGMIMLVVYHPYFLIYNLMLMTGFAITFFVLSRGALKRTLEMSHAKYDVFNFIQEVSRNALQLKATDSKPFLIQKTDALVSSMSKLGKHGSPCWCGSISGLWADKPSHRPVRSPSQARSWPQGN